MGLVRSAKFYTTGGAFAASLGLAAQSCGVWSSGEDCSQRAVCPGEDGGSDDTGAIGVDARGGQADRETGGTDRDLALGDAAGDMTRESWSDVGDAANASEVGQDVGASKDAASEYVPPPDAVDQDAGGDAAPDTTTPDGDQDGCRYAGPEDCSNGVDDDCNGKVDCADPACSAYTCAPQVPSGWFGPVGLWQGPVGSTVPSCSAHYQSLIDANAGLSAPQATCSCSCTASGQVCSASGTFHPDQACTNAVCATVTPAPTGACTAVPSNSCGSGGSFNVAATPVPSGGSCAAQVTPTIPPLGWTTSARVCSYAGSLDSPGGCTGASEQCVAAPTSPFGAHPCVYSTADPAPTACPSGYDTNPPIVIYSASTDTRGCGSCACSGPSGGTCSGSISVYGGGGCTGNAGSASYSLGSTCQAYASLNPVPGSAKATLTAAGGSCSVQTQPPPTGTAVATRPTTVCCL